MSIRLEYTDEQERNLRITGIMAILENNLFEDEEQERELMAELADLDAS